jgi:hypothetical protein
MDESITEVGATRANILSYSNIEFANGLVKARLHE